MNYQKLVAFGPLPIRILAGISFIIHGLPKLSNIAGSQMFFGKMGLPPNLAMLIGLLEVIGGIALLVGVLTRVASILFIIQMIGAILSLLLTGPGRISIEWDVLKRELFPKA
jgi:putative oxidoreductase